MPLTRQSDLLNTLTCPRPLLLITMTLPILIKVHYQHDTCTCSTLDHSLLVFLQAQPLTMMSPSHLSFDTTQSQGAGSSAGASAPGATGMSKSGMNIFSRELARLSRSSELFSSAMPERSEIHSFASCVRICGRHHDTSSFSRAALY